MELLLNGINGQYLRNILLNAAEHTERVDAAVAYATADDLLFDWCWESKIPLHFWGRFDAEVPVAVPILQKFLDRKSGRYVCKLVRKFHPKVIWWRGYGAYIGSANLTQSAWWNNVEAGIFLTEDELVADGHDLHPQQMFSEIDRHAGPLTDELFKLIAARNKELSVRKAMQKSSADNFEATELVPQWEGLARMSGRSAGERSRAAFIDEWNSTLQIIRDIASKISTDANRPSWVGVGAPLGAQADQFLHAHYYQRTFEGRRANFESHFDLNRKDPDGAVDAAAKWWRSLPSTSDENHMLNVTAPLLRDAFSSSGLRSLTEDSFVEVMGMVHSVRDFARRAPNKSVGLAGGKPYDIPHKMDALARHIGIRTAWRTHR